jgi:hypothetical protein
MSNLENTLRTVSFYTDNSKAASSAERLVILRWKEKKDKTTNSKKAATPARCVSIPKLDIAVEPAILKDALLNAFYEMQDAYIREAVEEQLETSPEKQPTINTASLQHAAIASWLKETASSSGKLSKAKIENWFDENLSDLLQAAFIQKLNMGEDATAEQLAKLETVTSNYKAAISSLASPRAAISPQIAEQMKKAISLADENDPTAKQLRTKLDTFLQPREITLEINL